MGEWDQVGTVRSDAGSNYVSLSGTEKCSWIDDRSAVACREAVSSGSADRSDTLYVLSWDEARGHYRMRGTDYETATVMTGTGYRSGRIWWWNAVVGSGGDRRNLRYVFEDGEGGVRRLTVSLKGSGGEWATVQNVTYTRAAMAEAAPPRRTIPRISGSASSASQSRPSDLAPPSSPPKFRIEAPDIRPVRDGEATKARSYPVPKLLPEGERPGPQ